MKMMFHDFIFSFIVVARGFDCDELAFGVKVYFDIYPTFTYAIFF